MLLYRRLFEYNVRLTMRQMIGHRLVITADGNAKTLCHVTNPKRVMWFTFSNRFYDDGVNTSPEAIQLYPVK